ncbi:hypothetical protein [Flavobacterium pectinovorum]|uniref:hypothetical protein n=1 Tax=Flavobacterium pectinovorum TaxID=29533 RepID=UPI001FAC3F0C|nr:hypothetical protein [Flavobacterium pectinovorum]MCI9844221.1 hypothetical protein [Flavobacterium pectinovorum]
MKKKLEADLISIAHRILKLKNKSDINQLYLETQKLYEKLAVLKFIDENFDEVKPTIGYGEIESQIETIFEKEENLPVAIKTEETLPVTVEETAIEAEAIPEPEIIEETPAEIVTEIPEIIAEKQEIVVDIPVEVVEEIAAKIEEPLFEIQKETETAEELSFKTVSDLKPIPDFKPAFELETEEIKTETPAKSNAVHISFEDILGVNYADAQFVKVDSFENVAPAPTPSINEFKEKPETIETVIAEPEKPKTVPLNEKLARGFHIDLNDRIAFTKNLFGNNTEDYSRVLNQLLTFDSFNEAKEFIETMVKPDYNDWEGKDDYAERFLEAIEKKFS